MQKKFLQVKLHQQCETKQGYESNVIGIYKVDLYTLAIGPIHHSIGLTDKVRYLKSAFIASVLVEWKVPRKAILRYHILPDEPGGSQVG